MLITDAASYFGSDDQAIELALQETMPDEQVQHNNSTSICSETTDMPQFEHLQNALLVRAPAKINLSLLIAGKRPDGFHELQTVMTKINWYDELLIEPGDKTGIELICKGPCWAPTGCDNLVYRACELLFEQAALSKPLRLTLTKNIPAGTGLGSASSDCAAALIGVNKYLKLGFTNSQLAAMAATLGADVAFFIGPAMSFCTGKGELITPLNSRLNFRALLLVPDISVSTKTIYDNYRHDQALFGRLSEQIRQFIEKNRIDLVAKMCANMLQQTCFKVHKELEQLYITVQAMGIKPICLSGSGCAMFYLAQDEEELLNMHQRRLKAHTGCSSVVISNNRW